MAKTEDLQRQWRAHCEDIRRWTQIAEFETEADRERRKRRMRDDYDAFCDYYFPHVTRRDGRHTPNAPFHSEAARKILKNPNAKLAFIWPRGHAKSTHMDVFIPMWLMIQEPRQINVMVLVGKSEESARALLSELQAELESNALYIRDWGEQKGTGSWEGGAFVTAGDCAFFARGKGQSPRGLKHRNRRPDYIVMDDIDDDQECLNPSRIRKATDWVLEALFNTFDAARGRFIICGNLISKTSILANLAANPEVSVSRVDALDADGNTVWRDKWTREEAEEARAFIGYRAFQKEYMNNPITEGAVFKLDWIHYVDTLPLAEYDELVCYCDPSFKGTARNDFKAAKLWGRKGDEYHCLRAFVRQCGAGELVQWFYDLDDYVTREGAACRYYMESNFIQNLLLDEFEREGKTRGYTLPISGDTRDKPDKAMRIESIAPLWERGLVYYDITQREDPDMRQNIDQLLSFERGTRAHDDAPDADEGALYILRSHVRETRVYHCRKPRPSVW